MKTLLTGEPDTSRSHTAVTMLDAGHDVVIVDNYYNSSPEACERIRLCRRALNTIGKTVG